MDRRRDRADPERPGRRGPGGGWDSFEEGMDRLRDRDRGRFEHRIDRQGEFTERLDDRLDQIDQRLARLEERAQGRESRRQSRDPAPYDPLSC